MFVSDDISLVSSSMIILLPLEMEMQMISSGTEMGSLFFLNPRILFDNSSPSSKQNAFKSEWDTSIRYNLWSIKIIEVKKKD